MPLGNFLQVAAPVIGGFLGYKGQQDVNAQTAAQNALLRDQYEQQKLERAPIVTGAQDQLQGGRWIDPATGQAVAQGTPGAQWQSQFQPFVDAAGQQSVAGSNIAGQYLANVPHYQQAGLQGLGLTQQLAGFTPFQQQQLAKQYEDPYTEAQYRYGAQDIQDQADNLRRQQAIRDAGRLTSLSSQAARATGQIEASRARSLGELGARLGSEAYRYGQGRAQQELARQTGLAGTLSAYGATGLSQAQQASQLGSGAQRFGVQAPFLPFQAYGQTLGQAPSVNVPQFGTTKDPFATGAGLALQSYNLLRGDQ